MPNGGCFSSVWWKGPVGIPQSHKSPLLLICLLASLEVGTIYGPNVNKRHDYHFVMYGCMVMYCMHIALGFCSTRDLIDTMAFLKRKVSIGMPFLYIVPSRSWWKAESEREQVPPQQIVIALQCGRAIRELSRVVHRSTVSAHRGASSFQENYQNNGLVQSQTVYLSWKMSCR